MVGRCEYVTAAEVESGGEDTPFNEDSMADGYQLVRCLGRDDGFDNI
jgi:hypothetical protein